MKDRSTLYLACAALGTLALAAAPAPQAHDNDAHALGATNQQQFGNQSKRNELVKIVKQVTAKYKSVALAENDGFQLLFGCVSDEYSGAMGLHYVKLSRYMSSPGVFDAEIKADEPEILLYEPTPWGPEAHRRRLPHRRCDLEQDPRARARVERADLPLLRRAEPLRSAAVLHAARLGVEGQPDRHVRELAQGSALRRARRS